MLTARQITSLLLLVQKYQNAEKNCKNWSLCQNYSRCYPMKTTNIMRIYNYSNNVHTSVTTVIMLLHNSLVTFS